MTDIKARDEATESPMSSNMTDDEYLRIIEHISAALDAEGRTTPPIITQREVEMAIRRISESDYRKVRYHFVRQARKQRTMVKHQKERAASLAAKAALSVGSMTAVGLLGAIAAPSAPAVAVIGAVAGLVGSVFMSFRNSETAETTKARE